MNINVLFELGGRGFQEEHDGCTLHSMDIDRQKLRHWLNWKIPILLFVFGISLIGPSKDLKFIIFEKQLYHLK